MARAATGPWGEGSKSPESLASMTDGELIEAASEWTQHTPYEMELQRRLTVALVGFKASMDRSSRWLIILTVVVTVLTAVLVVKDLWP